MSSHHYSRVPNEQRLEKTIMLRTSKEWVSKVDDWGIPNGLTSRSDAVRTLVRKALEAEAQQK